MNTIEIGPGHQATKPAKNPQNGPSTLCVQTYSDPSSGNIRPSWAVTNAPVIRKVANPTIQKTNTDGPANCSAGRVVDEQDDRHEDDDEVERPERPGDQGRRDPFGEHLIADAGRDP